MDVGIVYQNPSRQQYEAFTSPVRVKGVGAITDAGSPRLTDTAFTTRNIKLRDNDLLIDVETGRYHRVIIIPPPKGEALQFQSTYEKSKESLTKKPLDKTIFRVGGNDYNAQELIKKYMIPMSVPKETQAEQVERAPSATRLIGVTPVKTDSIPMSSGDDTYRDWLLQNAEKKK